VQLHSEKFVLTLSLETEAFLTLYTQFISKDLKDFYVFEENALNNPQHVAKFWQNNQNIKSIGEVAFKVQDLLSISFSQGDLAKNVGEIAT